MSYLCDMEVRAKKALGQHFLTDQSVATRIVGALQGSDVLEVGPGMGVLTQYLIPRTAEVAGSGDSTASLCSAPPLASLRSAPVPPLNVPRVAVVSPAGPATSSTSVSSDSSEVCDSGSLRGTPLSPPRGCRGVEESSRRLVVVEIDKESVEYLKKHYPSLGDGLIEGDFLKMDLSSLFPGQFSIIGNFPYNISSQIFFKILDCRDLVPEVVCMIQKEVAERIAEKPGTKTYGILSVFLQAWYDIEYLFTVGPGAFNPPPKVQSAVIRLTRNSRTSLGCDEKLFRTVVKTAFGQRRKTLRNSLKPLIRQAQGPQGQDSASSPDISANPVFDLRPERLSVEDFIALTLMLQQ